jgi:general stress protein YciG
LVNPLSVSLFINKKESFMANSFHTKPVAAKATTAKAAATTETPRAKAPRGFAKLSADQMRAVASLGGKAAHEAGTAHEFTPSEARDAGRKGGMARAAKAKAVAAPSQRAQ